MHETFFGLKKRPFVTVPTLERYCPVASQEAAFQSSSRAIARAEGPVAILGGTGLGKSMVCLRIGEVFCRNFEVILLASSQLCSRRALLQSLLFELRMPYRDLSEGELRLSLLDRLQPSNENPSDGLVLIVDEAQTLSMKLLDELRLLTNLARDGVPRVRLVLCGTMRLEEMLGHPQLESLNQRLACRCYLAPLNQHETLSYLTHKIELCGASIHSTFTDDAMRLIHRATDGVPRLIDQLADQSLRLAAEARQRPVSATLIEAAWASLQQLPLPWSDTGTPIADVESSIEYGSLSDDNENDFATDTSPAVEIQSLPQNFESFPQSFESFPQRIESPAQSFDAFPRSLDALPQITESLPLSIEAWPMRSEGLTIPSGLFASAESLPIERPIVSPIPSAGMGLSRVAASVFQPPQPLDPLPATDVWDDFLNPSDRRFETGPIEDYLEELIDPSPGTVTQPQSFRETAETQVETHQEDAAIEPQVCEPKWYLEPLSHDASHSEFDDQQEFASESVESLPIEPRRELSSETEDLFGSDFDEEIVVQPQSLHPSDFQRNPSDAIESLTFEIDATSQPYESSWGQSYQENLLQPFDDASLKPYEELLDSLSSANLEAMTLDPSDTLGSHSFVKDQHNLPQHHDFEGGLARQTRNSILSFADLQEDQTPSISDDRDLLIIEDDIPMHGPDLDLEVQSPAVVHPYKQLFSKLRG